MAQLTPRFSANRTMREYTVGYYLPAAAVYRERVMDAGARGKRMIDWLHAFDWKSSMLPSAN
jgi:glycogen phosphorylase